MGQTRPRVMVAVAIIAVLISAPVGMGAWIYGRGCCPAFRGGLAQDEGRLDVATGHFRRADDRNPNACMVAHDLACCYSLKNERKNSLLCLRRALEGDHADTVRNRACMEVDFINVGEDEDFKALIDPGPRRPW